VAQGYDASSGQLERVYGALVWSKLAVTEMRMFTLCSIVRRDAAFDPRETDHPWEMDDPSDERFHYFYFVADEDENFKSVTP